MRMSRQSLRIGLVAGQWLFLTIALAAVVVRSSSATSGVIEPHLDGSWVIIAAFLTAFLLGITVASVKALAPLAALMWLIAAGALALVVMLPVWDGVIPSNDALTNYAINQLVVLPLLMALPGGFGALCGNLVRHLLGGWQELLPPPNTESERQAWWVR